jgi:GTPase SAR1 family protein
MIFNEKESDAEKLKRIEKDDAIKIILCGDSAVGKTKLMERFLLDKFFQQQLSTYALTIFPFETNIPKVGKVSVRFWDTAGQNVFDQVVCICIFVLVFILIDIKAPQLLFQSSCLYFG